MPNEMFETGPSAKERLIFEAAIKRELGFKLCERHYYSHVEGSQSCIFRTVEQLDDVLEELNEEFDLLDGLLDELIKPADIIKCKDMEWREEKKS